MTKAETDADGVTVERFEAVDEFLGRLQRADDIASGRRFLFRGAPDATLPLLPSALRLPSPFKTAAMNAAEQARHEVAALYRFYEAAHYGGLTIPSWPEVQAYFSGNALQRENILEFIALAQHHGTPTTLLDWTLDPFVAAYFAASDLNRNHARADDMAVWWFDPSYARANGYGEPWSEVRIPFDVNQNARAQRGVFIEYKRSSYPGNGPVVRESLIEAVKGRDAQRAGPQDAFRLIDAFAKFTLPRARTLQLLNTLRARHRISASILFPGYYGAAREERERCAVGDL